MPATFLIPLITVIPGQLITASLWNNEYNNLYVNLIPGGIDTYSNTDTQMQTSTDPFPGGSTSRPTSLAGELERIRYILNLIIGQTYWYNHPNVSLETIYTTPIIPSGTVMPFYQAAAPTGWTAVALNDKFLRVVTTGTTGGTTGGSGLTPSSALTLAHSHTVASHTHSLSTHTHTMGNHTHSTPAHRHQIENSGNTSHSTASGSVASANSDGADLTLSPSGIGATSFRTHTNRTENSGSGTSGTPSTNTSDGPSVDISGAATPATDSQLSNTAFQYADFIIASKN